MTTKITILDPIQESELGVYIGKAFAEGKTVRIYTNHGIYQIDRDNIQMITGNTKPSFSFIGKKDK